MNLEFRGDLDSSELDELTQAMKLFENNYYLKPKDALIHVIRLYPKKKRILYMISPEGLEGLYPLSANSPNGKLSSPNGKLISANLTQKILKIEIEDWKYAILFNPLLSKN